MKLVSLLIYALFLVLPFGQLEKLPLGVPGISLYLHDLILGCFWVILFLKKRKELFQTNRLVVKLFYLFTGLAFLGWLVNYFYWGKASLVNLGYLVRWVLVASPFFVFQFFDVEKKGLKRLFKISLFLLVVFGWVQYFYLPDLRFSQYFGWDDHYYRLTGTLLDPNFFGLMIVLALGLEFQKRGNFWKKIFYLLSLAFTYSRSSWLAWLALLFFWGLEKVFYQKITKDIWLPFRAFLRALKVPLVCFWLAVSLIIVYFLPLPSGEGGRLTRTVSINGRWQSYQNSWDVIKENFFTGVGFNNYRLAQEEKNIPLENLENNHAAAGVDNSFLFVWATTGIFGLAVFIGLVFQWQPLWLVIPLVAHSFFNNSLFFPWVLILVWSWQGLETIDSLK